MESHKILAFYASGSYFSGQKAAFETVLSGLENRGCKVTRIKLPCVERSTNSNFVLSKFAILKVLTLTSWVWFKSIFLVLNRKVFICLGQTPFSMMREGLPVLLSGVLNHKREIFIATHGNNFMAWKVPSMEVAMLKGLVHYAKFISVLGPNQKSKLEEFGIPSEKIVIIDNTSEQELISLDLIKAKHSSANGSINSRVRLLYLSSLIEGKGYIDFLNAVKLLSKNTDLQIDVFLCGKLTSAPGKNLRFKGIVEAESWLTNIISEINSSKNIQINWINGIQGAEKKSMYYSSHIFVLPTQYVTEAQPLVLLEALTGGCAIITTEVGEIASTLSAQTALFLKEISPTSIATSISSLVKDPDLRLRLAISGHSLFQERFSYDKHIDRWEKLFDSAR